MRSVLLALGFVVAAGLQGCTCADNAGGVGDDLASNPDAISGGDLNVTPAQATIDIVPGGTGAQGYTARLMDGTEVTAQAVWSVDDPTLGSFNGATFNASGVHGGTTLVHATYQNLGGYATLHVKLHASITTETCPGCPAFPPDTTPACNSPQRDPSLLYPPDGTLLPPNMNVIQTQFDQGSGNTLFEIDFQNAATDVRVLTQCNAILDTRKLATNGCSYDLSQAVWDFIAGSNRGGDPLQISVRAVDATAACIATSSSRSINFATEDLTAGIYYWQSVTLGGVQGKTGGIFRYDFGKRNQAPDPYLSPSANVTTCIGCHYLSRDGQKMTYGSDDADADDEYGDLKASLIDVASKMVSAGGKVPPGFQTFSPDHKLFLASDGKNKNLPAAFFLFDGETGAAATPATVPSGTRGTHPDWSPDGKSVVFVQPKTFFLSAGKPDDDHFAGGSLMTMSFDGSNNTFGAPQPLITSQGENNYYPAWAPDGQYLLFNRVPGVAGTDLAEDAFSNPKARVVLIKPQSSNQVIDLPKLNGSGDLTNSWPRFAPLVQTYKGRKIAWVTFSSTRDYGARVRNGIKVDNGMGLMVDQRNCSPPESPQTPPALKNEPLAPECHQPQIWMTAIDLSTIDNGEFTTGSDASYPPFWLPFQDVAAHNHIAQWVTQIVGAPVPDGGVCIPLGDACTAGVNDCCGGVCVGNLCGIP